MSAAVSRSEAVEMTRHAHKKWTPDEEASLRKLMIEGKTSAEIAFELKRSLPSVKSRAQLRGISLGFCKSK